MALTVPSIQNITNGTNGFDFQTVWDQQDFNALAISNITGVYDGCQVVPNAVANYGASVVPGHIVYNGSLPITVTGGSVAVAAADAYDRRDIVVANSAGAIGIVKGTDCANAGWLRTTAALPPVKPSLGASLLLSEIAVPGGSSSVTAMNASCIIDKRCMLVPSVLAEVNYNQTTPYTMTSSTITAVDSTNLTLTFIAPFSGKVRLRWSAVMSASIATDYMSVGWLNHGAGTLFTGSHIWTSIGWAVTKPLALTHDQVVSGLTYGTSYSVDLAWGTNAGLITLYPAAITSTTASNVNGGPVHLIAEAA